MTVYFNKPQDFLQSEINRLKFVIDDVEFRGEKALHEFDIKRGIDKQQALDLLNKQLAYFKSQSEAEVKRLCSNLNES